MAFIRTRKIKYDENNKIISGTAAIIESKYVSRVIQGMVLCMSWSNAK
ncbi:MAG: hypothetical protein IJ583_05820 [Firmicutes bacterium]|nr:hypothetical protein [Bacillota bacterium]